MKLFGDIEPRKGCKSRRSSQAMASPCQELQRGIAAFAGFPSGAKKSRHLLRYVS